MLIFHMKCHVASHIKGHARVSDIHFNYKLCSVDLYNNITVCTLIQQNW